MALVMARHRAGRGLAMRSGSHALPVGIFRGPVNEKLRSRILFVTHRPFFYLTREEIDGESTELLSNGYFDNGSALWVMLDIVLIA